MTMPPVSYYLVAGRAPSTNSNCLITRDLAELRVNASLITYTFSVIRTLHENTGKEIAKETDIYRKSV